MVWELFLVLSALCAFSKPASFCEQDVKSLVFFLYKIVVQCEKERKKEI
jgi:hypothetical protein